MRPSSLVPLLLFLLGAGWRHDGTARFPDASPPADWAARSPAWSTKLPSWGNASPVLLGDLVCTTAEPTHVLCLDAASGELRWSARNERLYTLPPGERPAMAARLEEIGDLEARVAAGLTELSRLRRETRRNPDDDALRERLTGLSRELDALQATRKELRTYLTPPDLDLIGWASATPATDGRSLYVTTGNGVVASYTSEGTRRWAVWMGEPVRPMRGFDFGSVTSPQLVDGLLLVGHRHLSALDPATGATVWRDASTWSDYGTPAILEVDGLSLIATPDGRILRARDGVELASGLADIYYTGPVAREDVVWWVGGQGHAGDPATNRVTSWKLVRDGDGVRTSRRFDRPLPRAERVYASPIVLGNRLLYLTLDNTLTVLDAGTGEERGSLDLLPALRETGHPQPVGYANPTLAGAHLFLGWEQGIIAAVQVADEPRIVSIHTLDEPGRATPWFRGTEVWTRTLHHMLHVE